MLSSKKFSWVLMIALASAGLMQATDAHADEALNSADEIEAFAKFDRLDGKGKSGKKVDVIEWEDNLEIHVYPKGSLKSLGLKLDENGDKKVMVISYLFNGKNQKRLIRRAILGIPMNEGFRAYQDLTADDYDKVIVSNNGLAISKNLVAFKLDAAPDQLYPDEHPSIAQNHPNHSSHEKDLKDARKPAALKPFKGGIPTTEKHKSPVAVDVVPKNWNQEQIQNIENGTKGGRIDPDTGSIRPFSW